MAVGALAGAVASVASAGAGAEACGYDPGGACSGLVRTLSLRVGLVAAAAAVLMVLLARGLQRMGVLDEERRAAGRRAGTPSARMSADPHGEGGMTRDARLYP